MPHLLSFGAKHRTLFTFPCCFWLCRKLWRRVNVSQGPANVTWLPSKVSVQHHVQMGHRLTKRLPCHQFYVSPSLPGGGSQLRVRSLSIYGSLNRFILSPSLVAGFKRLCCFSSRLVQLSLVHTSDITTPTLRHKDVCRYVCSVNILTQWQHIMNITT